MPYIPPFTSPLSERTSSPDSVLGSIAASCNLPVEDGAAWLAGTTKEAIFPTLVSKWPTLAFQLQRAGTLTNRLARDARATMVTVDDPFPETPPNVVLARAAVMLATEGSLNRALELLTVYAERPREGYPYDQEARIEALFEYHPDVSSQMMDRLEDFPRVEAALARLISIDRQRFRSDLGLGKSTVRDQVGGWMEWGGREQLWLADRIGERAEELRRFLACDDAVVAVARPALVGLAWQLWPDLQEYIEETSRWIHIADIRNI